LYVSVLVPSPSVQKLATPVASTRYVTWCVLQWRIHRSFIPGP